MTATIATKSRPIIFTGESVPQIDCGAKTMTRRKVTPQPPARFCNDDAFVLRHRTDSARFAFGRVKKNGDTEAWPPGDEPGIKCPYFKGQRLWVREKCIQIGLERTFKGQYLWPKKISPEAGRRWFDNGCHYAADLPYGSHFWDEPHGTLSALFMPRWASRLTLEILDVRAERLFEISEADARAEGCRGVAEFRERWVEINGEWDDCWVWAITFRRVENDPT